MAELIDQGHHVEDVELPIAAASLRFRFAVNSFKALLLNDFHEPGKHQTVSVFEVLDRLPDMPRISERTWEDWFSGSPPIPKIGKVRALDSLASAFLNGQGGDASRQAPTSRRIFCEMVHGGLMNSLSKPTKSKKALNTLVERASEYQPLSSFHLHFDAIEVASWVDDVKGVLWSDVTALAARRILDLLAERWAPRHGKIYPTFSSDLRLRWDKAGPDERVGIRDSYARWKPDSFDRLMQPGAHPNWQKIGCDLDVAPMHIYKLLFNLAADYEFLVKDRLSAWAIDLATASLAMHALAWTDRYTTMAYRTTDELLHWAAFDDIFFGIEPLEDSGWGIASAMANSRAEWGSGSFEVFCKAREIYRALLVDGGISDQDVLLVSMQARTRHPLIYYGGTSSQAAS